MKHLLRQSLEAKAHPTMRRHAVPEGFEVFDVMLRLQSAGGEALDQFVIAVDSLPARADLDSAIQEVEARRPRRIARERHCVDRPARARVTGDEEQLAAELFVSPFANKLL